MHRHRRFVQLEPTGLDTRMIEHLVDQRQQVFAGTVDVLSVFLVAGHRMAPHELILEDLGKAENGVERRAQFVAHGGRKWDLAALACSARLRASMELTFACSSSAMSASF